MDAATIMVDSGTINLSCLRFIYQQILEPIRHDYELIIIKEMVDSEILLYANLHQNDSPTEKQIRDWVYWLGHIISRYSDPNDCTETCWVAHNVQFITETPSEFVVCGQCHPWKKITS
jgi:hypothetical protein